MLYQVYASLLASPGDYTPQRHHSKQILPRLEDLMSKEDEYYVLIHHKSLQSVHLLVHVHQVPVV